MVKNIVSKILRFVTFLLAIFFYFGVSELSLSASTSKIYSWGTFVNGIATIIVFTVGWLSLRINPTDRRGRYWVIIGMAIMLVLLLGWVTFLVTDLLIDIWWHSRVGHL